MPVYESGTNNSAVAAVAIVVLVLLALAGGWVLLSHNGGLDGHKDIKIELPGKH